MLTEADAYDGFYSNWRLAVRGAQVEAVLTGRRQQVRRWRASLDGVAWWTVSPAIIAPSLARGETGAPA